MDRPLGGPHRPRVFDGRFSDLELRDLPVIVNGLGDADSSTMRKHLRAGRGPALPLPDPQADPDLQGEPDWSRRRAAWPRWPERLDVAARPSPRRRA